MIVPGCFAFGRLYGPPINARTQVRPPCIVRTLSVTSGECNNPQLAGYDIPATNDRGQVLPESAAAMRARAGEYAVVQDDRFATGARLTGSDTTWDCTSLVSRSRACVQALATDDRALWRRNPAAACLG